MYVQLFINPSPAKVNSKLLSSGIHAWVGLFSKVTVKCFWLLLIFIYRSFNTETYLMLKKMASWLLHFLIYTHTALHKTTALVEKSDYTKSKLKIYVYKYI